MILNYKKLSKAARSQLSGAPEGLVGIALAELAQTADCGLHFHVARDDRRLATLRDCIAVIDPTVELLEFPAWDCLPYDRVSPNADVVSRRLHVLSSLSRRKADSKKAIVITTMNAVLQRVPPQSFFEGARYRISPGEEIDLKELSAFLVRNGYLRTGTVREQGEYAFRGGIIDIFPTGSADPVRIDLFGDEVETIKTFDPQSQLSRDDRTAFDIEPVCEFILDAPEISRFREAYRALFGSGGDDPIYEAVSEGRRIQGMEHWLPLYHDHLETLFDYAPGAAVTFDHLSDEAASARFEAIEDFYQARVSFLASRTKSSAADDGSSIYRPLPPERLYLTPRDWRLQVSVNVTGWFTPFSLPEGAKPEGFGQNLDLGGRPSRDFSTNRVEGGTKAAETQQFNNVYDAVAETITNEIKAGRRVAIAAYSTGSRDRIRALILEHNVKSLELSDNWLDFLSLSNDLPACLVLPVEHGFRTSDITVISEQDMFGERLVRPRQRRAKDFITDSSELTSGDYVVHVDHGIGRYEGLETISAGGAPHDCLRLTYHDGDRLFVPVENIEILTRFGSESATVALDRLGSAAWQARKSRLKERLKDMAQVLIKVAAERALRPGRKILLQPVIYQEFCAGFPYETTHDQQGAIDDTVNDLASGKPMDRLICGDVGFGKTEIALRAAFSAVMAGGQVAIIAPTTLLCRQHLATFSDRFRDYPVRIGQLSRMVTAADAAKTREGMASGQVDIVIGTHALLSKSIKFNDLSLLVIDEEQHFGVTHKERLKRLRSDVHVLTLSATPIPRTLQMALTGVKDMSIIATPPVDRLAVRTFILPYDPVIVREAIMREKFRGGQIFYVCPRISDLEEIEIRLRELVPDIRISVAHGRMSPNALEDVMTEFYEGRSELLLSTQIIESGLDIPTANTMLIHRADMFGLAQLYQLRGRIGRSKQRAYCYLTLPLEGKLTDAASKRLEVMQSLDSLGAGFTLASHDLDIRGAGNLLGDEQSGHIHEVGVELYQQMLEEAVASARGEGPKEGEDWSPDINIGAPVLIPESYVADLDARLMLYRRLVALETRAEIEAFAAELIDRFGDIPNEVNNLLEVIVIKQFCRLSGIEKLDAGPKGAVIAFHDNSFARPDLLIGFIQGEHGRISLRPDHRLVLKRDWANDATRLKGTRQFVSKLAELAQTQ